MKETIGLLLAFAIVGGIAIVNCDVVKRWNGLGLKKDNLKVESAHRGRVNNG